MPVLFFDVGATLADVRVAADGSLTFVPRPRVLAVLDAFREVRKGIMSDPGPGAGAAARAASALHDAFPGHFTDDRLVHWGPKNGPGVFERAVAATAGEDTPAAAPDACVFVGEDPLERAFAARAGLRTAPHPVFTLAAVEGRPVFRARIALPADRALPAIYHWEGDLLDAPAAPDRPVPALATARGAEALRRAGYTVDLHGPVGTPEPLE